MLRAGKDAVATSALSEAVPKAVVARVFGAAQSAEEQEALVRQVQHIAQELATGQTLSYPP